MEYVNQEFTLSRAHDGDAGLDLLAIHDREIAPGQVCIVKTGTFVKIPHGYYGQIATRSSMAVKGISVLGGVIDSGYRGELMVILINHSNVSYNILRSHKIAQLIILPIWTGQPIKVESLQTDSSRGTGGFGSTGL